MSSIISGKLISRRARRSVSFIYTPLFYVISFEARAYVCVVYLHESRFLLYLFFFLANRSPPLSLSFPPRVIHDGVYNASYTGLDPDIHRGVYVATPARHLHQSRDAIKTKITMQCNQRRTRGSFRLKRSPRDYRSKPLFCRERTPLATGDCVSAGGGAKRYGDGGASRFEDRGSTEGRKIRRRDFTSH